MARHHQRQLRQERRTFAPLAITLMLLTTALVGFAPTAAAANGNCRPQNVNADAGHSPAFTWSNHNTPRWTWNVDSWSTDCYTLTSSGVVGYNVLLSWGGTASYSTSSMSGSVHVAAPDGQHSISVATRYSYCHYHAWYDPCHVHNDGVTSYVTGQQVWIDTVAPKVGAAMVGAVAVDGVQYASAATVFSIAATDERSGIASVQVRLDGGAWSAYPGAFTVDGEDGAHLLEFRATDRATNGASGSLAFVLDNTAPALRLVSPGANSLNVGSVSVEPCAANPRVTVEGETVYEAPGLPETPEAPEVPETPALPEVIAGGPDACAGEVVRTARQTVAIPVVEAPALPGAPDVPQPPGGLPVTPPGAPDMPTPDVPETPAVPGEIVVEGQHVSFAPTVVVAGVVTFVVEAQDATVGTRNVQMLVDGALVLDLEQGDGLYAFEWDATGTTAGHHVVTFRGFDRLGNVGETSFTVLVGSSVVEEPQAPDAPGVPETPELPEQP